MLQSDYPRQENNIMLKRKAYDRLIRWKNQDHKKALCIIGARQIGNNVKLEIM